MLSFPTRETPREIFVATSITGAPPQTPPLLGFFFSHSDDRFDFSSTKSMRRSGGTDEIRSAIDKLGGTAEIHTFPWVVIFTPFFTFPLEQRLHGPGPTKSLFAAWHLRPRLHLCFRRSRISAAPSGSVSIASY